MGTQNVIQSSNHANCAIICKSKIKGISLDAQGPWKSQAGQRIFSVLCLHLDHHKKFQDLSFCGRYFRWVVPFSVQMDQGVERCESSGTENSMSESSIQTSSGVVENTDMRGKQKKLADLEKLNKEIQYLEEELEELDKIATAEDTCKRMILVIEHRPDPLLPITKGPENPSWDRWFEGPGETDGCRCWIS